MHSVESSKKHNTKSFLCVFFLRRLLQASVKRLKWLFRVWTYFHSTVKDVISNKIRVEWFFRVILHCSLSTTNIQVTDAFLDDAKRPESRAWCLTCPHVDSLGLRHGKTNPQIVKECGVKAGLHTLVDFLLVVF